MSLVDYTGRYYELPSSELARWLEKQGADCWWCVDGDPILTARLSFPCPTDELAAELRAIDRSLLVAADEDRQPKVWGQIISAEDLDRFVGYTTGRPPNEISKEEADRYFYLCWKGQRDDWFLNEDRATAAMSRKDAIEQEVR